MESRDPSGECARQARQPRGRTIQCERERKREVEWTSSRHRARLIAARMGEAAGRSAADSRHRAGRLLEVRRGDPVPGLLGPSRVDQKLGDRVIARRWAAE